MSEKPKVVAVIQARMLSSRLRGKSLMSIAGVPLIQRVIEKVREFGFVDEIVVATSDKIADDPLVYFAKQLGVHVHRGHPDDVLSRFATVASNLNDSDIIVRCTADNPMYDPDRSTALYTEFTSQNADYACIDGLSHVVPEFIRVSCLRFLNQIAIEPTDREHVTIYLRRHQNDFKKIYASRNFHGIKPQYDRYFAIDYAYQIETLEGILLKIEGGKGKRANLDECYAELNDKYGVPDTKDSDSKRLNFAGLEVGDGCQCFIIAEIGQNHNGQINLAKRLIDMAARCGANAVKFQKREISWELTKEAYDKPYEGPNSFGKTYGLHREYLELGEDAHRELRDYALASGLMYFCTPCDPPSVQMLERIGNPVYKIASRDITNIPLLIEVAQIGKPTILSTGMVGMEEIGEAVAIFQAAKCPVALMQCVSQYPAEPRNINLRAMKTLREKFDVLVALSDHTTGVITGVAGAVVGAFAVEKHITLSRAMPGTDHAAALEEDELRELVRFIRICEEAMGDGQKLYNPVAESAKQKLARSLVCKSDLPVGSKIEESMLTLRSPGTGLAWRDRGKIIGRIAKKHIEANALLDERDFE